MTEGTKEHPAPLDAFDTAKPDEPIWTVQGGDPLGGPLLRVWALLARIRAGVTSISTGEQTLWDAANAAANSKVSSDREKQALLIRATETEKISWNMDSYRKGHSFETEAQPADGTPDELARLDLHDYRVRAVGKVQNAVAELIEIREQLDKRGFLQGDGYYLEEFLRKVTTELQQISEVIEPRRLFRGD